MIFDDEYFFHVSPSIIIYGILISIATLIIASLAQTLLKLSAQKSHPNRWKEYFNPLLFGAYFLFTMTNFMMIVAYRFIPLSMGPILQSLGYLLIHINGVLFLKERISRRQLLGLSVILLGVSVFILYSGIKTIYRSLIRISYRGNTGFTFRKDPIFLSPFVFFVL